MHVIGYIAAVLTVAAFVPQAYRTVRTRRTRDLSLATYLVFVCSSLCWVVYGVGRGSPEIYVTNAIVLVFAGAICVMKVVDDRLARAEEQGEGPSPC